MTHSLTSDLSPPLTGVTTRRDAIASKNIFLLSVQAGQGGVWELSGGVWSQDGKKFGNCQDERFHKVIPAQDIHRCTAMEHTYLLTLCNQFTEFSTNHEDFASIVRLKPALILTLCPK